MIELYQLANKLQEELNKNQDLYEFNIVCDTAEFKKSKRENNEVTEIINGYFSVNGSDISTLNSGALVSTINCSLRVIMRMKGFEEDVYGEFEGVDDNGAPTVETRLVSYGDNSRIKNMREYLDGFFKGNTCDAMTDKNDKKFIVSAIYNFSQSGQRGQVERLGDSFMFSTEIFYTIVQEGINTRMSTFILDGVVIPFQSMTIYRTPTMDGNVYANTKDGATKNLASQSTFSVSFELPALEDDTTANMLDFLFNGDINQAHLLTVDINKKTKNYLVTYGETKLIGQTVQNLGQTLSLVECPNIYDLISFGENYYIYKLSQKIENEIDCDNAQVYVFGQNSGFVNKINNDIF